MGHRPPEIIQILRLGPSSPFPHEQIPALLLWHLTEPPFLFPLASLFGSIQILRVLTERTHDASLAYSGGLFSIFSRLPLLKVLWTLAANKLLCLSFLRGNRPNNLQSDFL